MIVIRVTQTVCYLLAAVVTWGAYQGHTAGTAGHITVVAAVFAAGLVAATWAVGRICTRQQEGLTR